MVDNDRRMDIVNEHDRRIAILEAFHADSIIKSNSQSLAIESLIRNMHATEIELKEGITTFNLKFDALISQVRVAFYIVSAGCTIFLFLFSTFINYNQELDTKYLKNINNSTELQKKLN